MHLKIDQSLQAQRDFYNTYQTRDIRFRIIQLKTLRRAILTYEDRIYDAFWKDLHKSKFEAYSSEIGLVLKEISLHIRKLKSWARPERVPTDQLIHFWSTSRIIKEPYGVTLIIAPWNYPFQLLLIPLVGAISAGNCIALKPSDYSPHVTEAMSQMISEFFSPSYISYHQGGRDVNQALFAEKWDYIFFTGSTTVGKIVMEAAAKHLTPVTLELGGKSPCIVEADANLRVAAARIAWGKFLNAGQTCVAPDYLFVHRSVKDKFISLLQDCLIRFFGEDPQKSPYYCRIINQEKTEHLASLIKGTTIRCGGTVNIDERYIAPTILEDVSPDHPLMQEEIFGPLLPVMVFDTIDEVIKFINTQPTPLSFYHFTSSKKSEKEVLLKTTAGGGCINDVVIQFANEKLPFGGMGNSGIGQYHGKFSFDTFSHQRSIMKKVTWIDIRLRYPPYRNRLKLIKYFMK